jgi:hypothetical protein
VATSLLTVDWARHSPGDLMYRLTDPLPFLVPKPVDTATSASSNSTEVNVAVTPLGP